MLTRLAPGSSGRQGRTFAWQQSSAKAVNMPDANGDLFGPIMEPVIFQIWGVGLYDFLQNIIGDFVSEILQNPKIGHGGCQQLEFLHNSFRTERRVVDAESRVCFWYHGRGYPMPPSRGERCDRLIDRNVCLLWLFVVWCVPSSD